VDSSAKIKASDTGVRHRFGSSVAIEGETFVVGEPRGGGNYSSTDYILN